MQVVSSDEDFGRLRMGKLWQIRLTESRWALKSQERERLNLNSGGEIIICRADRSSEPVTLFSSFFGIHSSFIGSSLLQIRKALGGHNTRGSVQNSQQIRYRDIPFNHRRR